MSFDYEHRTKEKYRSTEMAEKYHAATSGTWSGRYIAALEQKAVRELLSRIKVSRILDLPAGTGKMAPVYKDFGLQVMSCDISAEMLAVARVTYAELGYDAVEFDVCDAQKVQQTLGRTFDAVVCIRLMHRVPAEIRRAILEEFSRVAPYTIVSYGISSALLSLRKAIVNPTSLGRSRTGEWNSMASVQEEVSRDFSIVEVLPVHKLISSEYQFLLRSRRFGQS